MEPWQSWGVAIAIGGGLYYYYTHKEAPKPNKTRAASISDASQQPAKLTKRRTEPKLRRKTEDSTTPEISSTELASRADAAVSTATESSKKRKAAKKVPEAKTSAPAVTVAANDVDTTEEDDNKAWAQQLAQLKKGTNLAPPTRTDSRNRTVKQSAAGATPTFSSASSNGAEADDDLSPAMSPSFTAGDVSDMLEAPTPGPTTLRLTDPANPVKARQPRQQAAFQEQETKKQRQNRKKKEEARLQREAEEQQRQALLEKTRRAAREARGEPAKNGMAASKPPTNSAWAAQAAARVTEAPTVATSGSNNGPLLDTFDQDAESTASSSGALANSTAATSTVTNFDNELPSEEDQLTLAKKLSSDESGWNTVPKGRKQKKKGTELNNGVSDSVAYAPTPVEQPAAPAVKAPAPATKTQQPVTNAYASLTSGIDAGSHPDDSEWGA